MNSFSTVFHKCLPADCLDLCVMWEEEMKYSSYLSSEMMGNQRVRRNEFTCVIAIDGASGREADTV